MGIRRAVVCAITVCALAAVAPSAAANQTGLSLPEPTGRYQVGEVALHLVNRTRPDPWQPKPYRELMVSVFYPTPRAGNHPAAPYMLPKAAEHFDNVTANDFLGLGVPPGQVDWAATATRVAQNAPVHKGSMPVVLYSPGSGEPRTWDTTLVADLASRGYVVVTIDNTYESPEVQFPDGSLATVTLPTDPNAFLRKSVKVRVCDTKFVLDQLAVLNNGQNPDADNTPLPTGLRGALDLTKVGMFGHSTGGTTAATAMDEDPRIIAGLNMDGNLTWFDNSTMPVAEHGLKRPFMLLGKDGQTDTGPGWQAFLANTPGWARYYVLRGGGHASFTDAQTLLPQAGLPQNVLEGTIGTINPTLSVRTQETYVSAFFDQWLRGHHSPLLDIPVKEIP